MITSAFSICTRCGKQRIFVKTYKETGSTGQAVYTETACPDKSCQKVVEEKLMEEEKRRAQYTSSSSYRNNPRNKKKVN